MRMSELIAAIDQGTTSTRCVLFDRSGQIVQLSQQEHEQIYPKPGWVEHDPLEIWGCTQEVISHALSTAQVAGNQILAVGVTNQRETTIVWDKNTGQPYGNAIVWQDTRTKEICDALGANEGPDRFRDLVGLPLSTYFSGPKLKWILENMEGVRGAAEKGEALFGTVDTWLIWWLTGGPDGGAHVIDVTNASRTMLMNLSNLHWNEEILDIFNIPAGMLPRIVPSSDPQGWGMTKPSGPFGAAIPICGDLGDQQAALVGQTCFTAGEVKNTYGTGCFMLMNTGERIVPSDSGLLTTVAYRLGEGPAVYALEGSIAITGALVQWLRDNLELISSAAEIETLARSVEDSGGIYFVPAFSGLFAPHWRSDARGVIVGLTRYINKGHIARSVLESTAYQTREVLDAMNADSGVELSKMKVDGGMVQNDLLMQFQADILNLPVLRPRIAETTALGAAYAAGLSVGFWESTESLREQWQVDKIWQPGMEDSIRSDLYHGWQKAVERSLNWVD
jgi:glycerol kinase